MGKSTRQTDAFAYKPEYNNQVSGSAAPKVADVPEAFAFKPEYNEGLKKKDGGTTLEPSLNASAPTPSTSQLPAETSFDFLGKDIDKNDFFTAMSSQTDQYFMPVTKERQNKEVANATKQQVFSNPQALGQYTDKRIQTLRKEIDDIGRIQSDLVTYYQPDPIGAPTRVEKKFKNEDAYNQYAAQIKQKENYINNLKGAVADVATDFIMRDKGNKNFNPTSAGRQIMALADPEMEKQFKMAEKGGATLPGIRQSELERVGINAAKNYVNRNPNAPNSPELAQLSYDYEKDFDQRNFQLTGQRVREKLGAQLYNAGKSGFWGYSPDDLDQAAANANLSDGEKSVYESYVKPLEHKIIGTDIPGSGFGRSFRNAIEKTSVGTGKTIADITGFRTEADAAQDVLNSDVGESRFRAPGENPTAKSELAYLRTKEKANKLTTEEQNRKLDLEKYVDVRNQWSRFKDGVGDITGQVALMALTTKGLGGIGGGIAASGTEGGLLGGMTRTAVGTALKNETVGLFINSYLNTYDNYLQQAVQLMPGDDKAANRDAYAKTMAAVEGLSERIFPDTKILKAFSKEIAPSVRDIASRFINKELTQQAAKAELQGALAKYLKPFGKEFVKSELQESTEEAVVDLADGMAQSIYGGQPFDITKTGQQAVNTFLATALYSPLVAGMAAHGASRQQNSQNAFFKSGLYDMAANPAAYLKSVEDLQLNGEINQQQANEKVKLIKSASDFLREMPAERTITQKVGDTEVPISVPMDYPSTNTYLLHRLNEGILQQQIDNTTDEVVKSQLNKDLKRSQDIRKGIFDGSIAVTPDLKEVTDNPEKAQELGIADANQFQPAELIGTPFIKPVEQPNVPREISQNENQQPANAETKTAKGATDQNAESQNANTETVQSEEEILKRTEKIQLLFDEKKSTEEIVSGLKNTIKDDFLNNQADALIPYLKNNPEIKFSKMFSVGRGEAHRTGDWTVLLSHIKDDKQLFSTVIHELYHSISLNKLLNDSEFEKKVDGLRNEAISQLGLTDYLREAKNTDFGSTKDLKYYGLLNPKEFIAELFSNKEFNNLLDGIQDSNKKSVLQKFADLIKNLLGIKDASFSDKIKKSILDGLDTKIELENDPFRKDIIENFKKEHNPSDFKYAPEQPSANTPLNEATNIIRQKIQSGELKGPYAEMLKDENNIPEFLKEIADQSFSRTASGSKSSIGTAEYAMVDKYGQELVNIAKELFPITQNTQTNEGQKQETVSGTQESAEENNIPKTPTEGNESKGSEVLTEKDAQPTAEALLTEPVEGESGSGITHAQTEETRQEFGLGESYEKTTKTDEILDQQATEEIKKGYDIDQLIGKIDKGTIPTDVENTILKKYKATLEAKIAKDPSDENIDQLKRLIQATDRIGSETGRALRSRQGMELRDDSLAGFFIQDINANLQAPLTEAQKETIIKEHEQINEAQGKYDKKIAQLESENAKLRADKAIKKAPAKKTKKTHEDYVKERQDLIAAAKEKLKKLRGDTQVTIVPYANQLFAIAPEAAKVVRSLVEEGVSNLAEITKNVYETFKEVIPELTEKDVHNIIAGDYNEKRKTRTELAATLRDLRDEALLMNRLEALQNGQEPKNEKEKVKRNQQIEALRQQIKDFKKAQSDAAKEEKEKEKEAGKKTPDQIALQTLKTRTKSEIAKIEEQLKNGNFEEEKKKEPLKLDEEATKLKDKLIKLRQERQIRLLRLEYERRSKFRKAFDATANVLNVPRSLMASLDFSAPLRQAAIVTVANPQTAALAGLEMFKQAFSQKRFDRWFYDLQETPRYKLMEQAGLYVADPHDPRLSVREEQFMSNLAEKIPIIGRFVKGSERAYVSYLNKMRVDLFNRYTDAFENDGFNWDNHPEIYKGLATFLNNSTGRGDLGPLEVAAPFLNSAFFSPRLMASRINILGLNPTYYAKLPPKIRQEAIVSFLKFISVGYLTIELLKAAYGCEGKDNDDKDCITVENDPRSSDFGKIKSGKTRWDIWGGFQQYVRIVTQLGFGQTKSVNSGTIQDLSGEGIKKTRADQLFSFFRGKLAPVPSFIVDRLAGRNVLGEKQTLAESTMQRIIPLVASDLYTAVKESGVKALFTQGIPATFGVGIQTYLPKGYDDKSIKDPVYKFLYDKNINISTPEKKKEMSDKDYQQFIKDRQPIIKEEWAQAIEYGIMINEKGHPTIDENAAVQIVPANKATYEQLTGLMKSIATKASRDVLKPKTEE